MLPDLFGEGSDLVPARRIHISRIFVGSGVSLTMESAYIGTLALRELRLGWA